MLASEGEAGNDPSGRADSWTAEGQADGLQDLLLSPSIQRTALDSAPAFELKLTIPRAVAEEVEAWARRHMQPDAYCDPQRGGFYHTTTLYLDTPRLDVFHRSPGFRRRKYRLRRYGEEAAIFLERKSRRGDRVRKRRSGVPLADLLLLTADGHGNGWSGQWFRERIMLRELLPACRISYCRTAFVTLTSQGPARLTLDRKIQGTRATGWDLTPVAEGHGILPETVICEFKFRHALPGLFKDLIHALQLQAGSVSKYRTLMSALGVVRGEGAPHA